MSKVYLSVLGNENGKTIDIPIGKTILGRGPLLGCADKKVSRNHAVLEVLLNGEIYLTPTHVNPCFYRTKSETSLRIIKKDAAQKIEPGDVFSLLPNSFQYEVCLTPSESNAKKDSSKAENDEKSGTNRLNENAKDTKGSEAIESDKSHDNKIEEKHNESGNLNESPPDKEETIFDEKESTKPEQISNKPAAKVATEETNKINKKKANKTAVDDVSDIEEIPLDDDDEDEDDDNPEDDEEEDEEEDDEDDDVERQASKYSKTSSSKSKPTQKASHRPRKRTLPMWLLKSASGPRLKEEANGPSRKTPAKKIAAGEKNRPKNASRGSAEGQRSVSRSSRQKQTIQRISLDDFLVSEEDWSSEEEAEEKRKTKRRRGSRRVNDDSGSDWEFDNRKQQAGRWKADGSSDSDWEAAGSRRRGRRRSKRYRDDSESGSDWETETRKKKATPVKKSPRGRRSKRSEKEDEDEDEDQSLDAGDDSQSRPPSQGSSRKREPCLFGKKCYRKNTSHFDVYSHPGDSDYTSPDEDRDNSDDKPECQYGIDCFRKNAKHRSDFRHTKKIRPKREASRKTGKKAKGDEDDNDPEDLSMEESDDYNPESDAS